ncbi:SCO family protein [Mariprofundus erugo]|nr:SCO family protein [Mariprofundus erugo]
MVAVMNKSLVKYGVTVLALVAVLVVVFWQQFAAQPVIPSALKNMGGDFELQSSQGPLALHDFRGKAVLIYFGYTHCPDVCPMALGVMAAAMQQAGDALKHRVAGIFISVDPRRDTPDKLDQYARFFDPRIKGVTGTPALLDKVAAAWRVDYAVPDQPADASYAVEHSTFIYLVNPDGKVAGLFDEKTSAAVIAEQLRLWLR